MSQQPSQRNSFFTTMLLMVTIFLGINLLMPKQPSDSRKSDEILTQIREDSKKLDDVSAFTLLPAYTQKLSADKDKNKWTDADVNKREFEGIVLVANAKLAAARSWKDDPTKAGLVSRKLNAGWMLLQQKYDHMHNDPVWTTPVDVPDDAMFPDGKATPDKVFTQLTAELSVRNKTDLVWGIFPGYLLIDFLVKVTGGSAGFSYWFAAFLLAFVVRLAILPWSMKQYRFSRQMMQLQPYVKEIQEKFKDKRTGKVPPEKQGVVQSESMALYREYGINPLAGCGSALIQMPFFLVVYQCMQLYRFEFLQGTFLWIHPGAGKFLGLTLAPNLGQTDQLLVIIYGISMVASQLLMPISDPSQVKTQRLMGIGMSVMFTFFMLFGYQLPAAFTLYWSFANILATVQALWAYKMPAPPLEKVQTVKGGNRPKPGFLERLSQLAEEQQKYQEQTGPGRDADGGNGRSTGSSVNVDPSFFGKTGSPRSKKKK